MKRPKPDDEGEMPLFAKTLDFLVWLVPLTNHFPRTHRHTVTRRLLDAALDFQEEILHANAHRERARIEHLTRADAHLDTVRLHLRMAHRLHWISPGQYEHASNLVAELGRLLGTWLRNTRQQTAA